MPSIDTSNALNGPARPSRPARRHGDVLSSRRSLNTRRLGEPLPADAPCGSERLQWSSVATPPASSRLTNLELLRSTARTVARPPQLARCGQLGPGSGATSWLARSRLSIASARQSRHGPPDATALCEGACRPFSRTPSHLATSSTADGGGATPRAPRVQWVGAVKKNLEIDGQCMRLGGARSLATSAPVPPTEGYLGRWSRTPRPAPSAKRATDARTPLFGTQAAGE